MNITVISTIIPIFISIVFMISMFLTIKIYYEINKFKKHENIIKQIIYWKSHFFFKKLIELKNLSKINLKYQMQFDILFVQYQKLISINTISWIKKFIELLNKNDDDKYKLIEDEKMINYHTEFEILKQKNIWFSSQLTNALEIENYCLDQIQKFYTIHDLILDEINQTIQNTNFELKLLLNLWKSHCQEIKKFEQNLYLFNFEERFFELKKFLIFYCDNILLTINYLKIIIVFKIKIPVLKTEIIKLLTNKLIGQQQTISIAWFETFYQLKVEKNENKINDFNNTRLMNAILIFYQQLIIKRYELNQRNTMRNYSQKVWKALQELNTQIKNWHNDLKSQIKNMDNKIYFNYDNNLKIKTNVSIFQKWERFFQNWNENFQKSDDDIFFNTEINNTQSLLQKTIFYLEDHLNVQKNLTIEKKRWSTLMTTIINIKLFFQKSQFNHVRQLYNEEFNKILSNFNIYQKALLNKKLEPQNNQFNLQTLLDLEQEINNLKTKIENRVLIRILTRQMFIKNNRFRFRNSSINNKMLNAEMLYLKGHYKQALEQLIEIYEINN